MTHVPWHPDAEKALAEGDVEEIHGIDSVELISVGIDIGTTTTHLMFSRLLARREGSGFSSKFRIQERETVYESPIILTPYVDETTIDAEAIQAFIEEVYEDAGFTPDDVDTGAVIVTGEASRKENAEAITALFSERSGKFVCATAGPNLESLMSAHGSGAIDHSLDAGADLLHVDIGGGTTKLAYIVGGFVQDTASINVGAHLVEFDDEDVVTRLEDAARLVADDLGLELELGTPISEEVKEALAGRFAELIFELVDGDPSPLAESLLVTERPEQSPFDRLTFAGGVAEFVYGRDPDYANDLGTALGEALTHEVESRALPVSDLGTGIRATVLGSTQHSMQVSGNTITITDESELPLRNVPMVPFVAGDDGHHHDDEDDHGHDHDHDHGDDQHTHGHGADATTHSHDDAAALDGLAADVREKLALYDIADIEGGFAFGFHLHGLPTYDLLSAVADAVIEGWREFDGEHPIVVVFDSDIGMNAGRIIADRVDVPVVAIDGVALNQFGYIDVGEPLEETGAVPVTIKSLVFEG